MKRAKAVTILLFIFSGIPFAVAEEKLTVEAGTVECQNKSGTIKRKIEVVDDKSGCTLFYTRNGGAPEKMAHAVNHRIICNDVKHKIIANLQKAGLNCN